MAGAVIAVGITVGTGLVLQSAMTVQDERPSTAAAPAEGAGIQTEQPASRGAVVRAHAVQKAEGAIAAANTVMAAAKGKTDARALSGFVAALTRFALLEPERIFELVEETESETAIVKDATAEADRVAASEAEAAETAAAEAEAQAAAEAAAEAEAAAAAEADSTAPSHPPNQRGGRDR